MKISIQSELDALVSQDGVFAATVIITLIDGSSHILHSARRPSGPAPWSPHGREDSGGSVAGLSVEATR